MKKSGDILYSLRRYENMDGNFTQISNDVFKLTNAYEFKVYCYLCFNYNRELGYSFPSLGTIAKNTNMSVKTVTRCTKNLEELGLIKVCKFESQNTKYVNNIYKIFIPIIVKNEIEDQEINEIKKVLENIARDTEGKIYRFTTSESENDNTD